MRGLAPFCRGRVPPPSPCTALSGPLPRAFRFLWGNSGLVGQSGPQGPGSPSWRGLTPGGGGSGPFPPLPPPVSSPSPLLAFSWLPLPATVCLPVCFSPGVCTFSVSSSFLFPKLSVLSPLKFYFKKANAPHTRGDPPGARPPLAWPPPPHPARRHLQVHSWQLHPDLGGRHLRDSRGDSWAPNSASKLASPARPAAWAPTPAQLRTA